MDQQESLKTIDLNGVSLGPSVAPCPVEASTVHGEAFIWVKSSCSIKSEILGFFFSAPKSRDNLTMKRASFPVMSGFTPILDPLTQRRRSRTTTTSRTSTRELGFHLVGLFLNFGPSSKLWPSTKNSGFKSQTTRPRSALSCPLLSPTQLISRFFIISGRRLHQRWKSDSLHWPCYYHQRTLYSRSVRASKRLPNSMYSSHSRAKSGCPMLFTTDVSEATARNCSKLLCDIDLNQGAFVLSSSSMERSFSSTSSSMERTLVLLSSLMERTLLLLSSLMERSLSSTSSFMERTIPLNSSFMESVFKSSALMALRAQISVCSPSLAEKHLKTIFKLIKSEASLLESTRDFICLSIFFHVYVFLIHFVISENYRASSSKVNQVWQVGPGVSNGRIQPHDFSGPNLNSMGSLDLTGTTPGVPVSGGGDGNSRIHKRNIHGILNAVSWGFLFPVGAIIARYMRIFESADPAWFYLHVSCQFSAYAIGVAGWATGLKLGSESKGIQHNSHRNIGIALFSIATLQMFAMLLRPRKDHKFRYVWNIYHHGVGYSILILGIINVFKGLGILNPKHTYKTAYIAVIATLGGITLLLEAVTWVIVLKRKSANSTKPIKA